MSNLAIRAEHLGKKYTLHHQTTDGGSLRYAITNGFKAWGQRLRHWHHWTGGDRREEFWALQDVSFSIQQGDRVGIIGRNGAGKSTLLKILSRITEPTTGRVHLHGRVASLLEVGTGFHPELTGRENIFLNGAILGMSRVEIKRKFDEIVAFAEVERFLDTPVKRYSSGMYVRLAFAVAAHLEPEILLIDEVLAVGDMKFQKKCLGKMKSVGSEGRTVIFVSHQMGMVTQLCDSVFLLDQGQVIRAGLPQETISAYVRDVASETSNRLTRSPQYRKNSTIYIDSAETYDSDKVPTTDFSHKDSISLCIAIVAEDWCHNLALSVALKDLQGRKIFTTETELDGTDFRNRFYTAIVTIPGEILTPGMYCFLIALHVKNIRIIDVVDEVCSFAITDLGSQFSHYEGLDYGCVFVDCNWSLIPN